jgi:hypothetical protein
MRNSSKNVFRPALYLGTVVTLMLAGNAKADILSFDTTLASPNTNPANNTNNLSWYNGSGNNGVQGGWTVNTNSTNGIEIGLRAKLRQAPGVIDTPTDVYTVPAGNQDATHARWNYEFSIDLRPNGVGTLTIGDISANTTLTVTDLTTSATATVNLFTTFAFDDSGFGTTNGTTGANRIDESTNLPGFTAGWGAQNSENPEFANFPLAGFNPNAADTYEFTLTVKDGASNVLATDEMEVAVAPEPSALILFGTVALGLLVFARRRLAA